jgi:hypothetical protein
MTTKQFVEDNLGPGLDDLYDLARSIEKATDDRGADQILQDVRAALIGLLQDVESQLGDVGL